MAGLWDAWTSPDGEVVESCTIVTREAVGNVATIHTRMPVVLDVGTDDAWLDPEEGDGPRLVEFLSANARTALAVEPIDHVPTDMPKAKFPVELTGIRTRDLLHAMQALSQLSYSPERRVTSYRKTGPNATRKLRPAPSSSSGPSFSWRPNRESPRSWAARV